MICGRVSRPTTNCAPFFIESELIKREVRQDLKTENSAEGTALLNAGGIL